MYRGATMYEITEPDLSEEQVLGTKVIAKAFIPDQGNMQVDFKEEAANLEEAVKKIKSKIDRYLDEHNLAAFSEK